MPPVRTPPAWAAVAALAVAAALLAPRPAAAQTYTWNNFSNSGTLWSTASNWDPGAAVPGPDTVLLFPSSDQRQLTGGYTSSYDSAFDVNALSFTTFASAAAPIVLTGNAAGDSIRFNPSSLAPSVQPSATL